MNVKYFDNVIFDLVLQDDRTNIIPRVGEHINILKNAVDGVDTYFAPTHYIVKDVSYMFNADKILDHVNVYLDQVNG